MPHQSHVLTRRRTFKVTTIQADGDFKVITQKCSECGFEDSFKTTIYNFVNLQGVATECPFLKCPTQR